MRQYALIAAVLCAGPGAARADEPATAPATAPPPHERVEEVGASVEGLADLAAALGEERASRELHQLSQGVAAAAVYVELGELLAAANAPSGAGWHWSVAAGGGAEDRGEARAAGDVTLSAGATLAGPSCAILDGAAQVSLLQPGGLSAAQFARLCLRGYRPSPEAPALGEEGEMSIPAHETEWLAITGHEAVGWNVRPSVDAAVVMDSSRFATAEAGLSVEGFRWHYRPTRSWAFGWVSMSQGYLGQDIGDDWRSLHHTTARAWFAEWRLDRPASSLADGVVQVLPIEADLVEAGDVLGTFGMSAVSIEGLGTHGVFLDGAIGFGVTTDEEDAPPGGDPTKPGALTGTWRLGLGVGRPALHARASVRRVLLPTLTGAVVVEDRQGARLHADIGPVFLDADAHRAHSKLYVDGDDPPEVKHDSWGGQGALWIRLGAHLRAGASLEIGRSFVFADPVDTPGALPAPAFGYLGLARVAWTTTHFDPGDD